MVTATKTVYICDIYELMNPTNMKQCMELVNERTIQDGLLQSVASTLEDEEEEKKRIEKQRIYNDKIQSLDRVFATISSVKINALTQQLHAMEDYMIKLYKSSADQAEIDMMASKKNELSKQRDVLCYEEIIKRMNEEISVLDYENCNDLIKKYGTAITNLQAAIDELGGAKDSESSALRQLLENKTKELVSSITTGDDKAIKEALANVNAIQTVLNNETAESDEMKKRQIKMIEAATVIANEQLKGIDSKVAQEEFSSKLTNLKNLYDMLIDRSEDVVKRAQYLKDYRDQCQDILAKKGLDNKVIELLNSEITTADQDKMTILKEASTDYKAAVNAVDAATTKVKKLNEAYLEAVEESNVEEAKKYKKQLDAAIKEKEKSENALQELEQSYSDQIAVSDVLNSTDTKGQQEQKEQVMNQLEDCLKDVSEKGKISNQEKKNVKEIMTQLNQVDAAMLEATSSFSDIKKILSETNQQLNKVSLKLPKGITIDIFDQSIKGRKDALEILTKYQLTVDKIENKYTELLKKQEDYEKKATLAKKEKEELLAIRKKLDSIAKISSSQNNVTIKMATARAIRGTIASEVSALNKDIASYNQLAEQEKNKYIGDSSGLSEEEGRLADEQAEKYSISELKSIAKLTNQLQKENKKYSFYEPWHLLFKDYNVKLTVPVVTINKIAYVPARKLAVALGGSFIENTGGKVFVIRDKGVLIEYAKGDKIVYVNDKIMRQPQPPVEIVSGNIYISLACFEKAYSLTETWSGEYLILSK